MALEGTLRDFSLADIFQLIGLQRKTGVLTLRSPEDVVTVSFLDGKVVGADSLNKRLEDRLGQVLLKTGLLSQDQLDVALKVQMETLERLGRILVKSGTLSRDDLHRALEQQILQVVFRVFRWNDGDYQFSQETSIDYDSELVTPISSESILMEGARMLDEWPIIEKRITNRGMVFVPTAGARFVEIATPEELRELETFEFESEPAPSSGRVRISPTERDVLALLDGLSTVEEVLKSSPFGEFDTSKALYTLLTRSLIREATRDEVNRALNRAAPAEPEFTAPAIRIPWLVLPLLPLLVAAALLATRNPLNPLVGPGPSLLGRFQTAASWARMAGTWQALHARANFLGAYPEALSELVREHLLPERAIRDPWARPYRYLLREQSVLIAGSTPHGAPDPALILTQHLGSETEEATPEQGATLEGP